MVADRSTARTSPNYSRVRSQGSLWHAWGAVKGNGLRSSSAETRRATKSFASEERTLVRRIADQLREKRFDFGKCQGIPIPREGKAPRPIVVAGIEARIVQRALLDELQGIAPLRSVIDNPHSFGGIRGRSRGDAIEVALEEIKAGATHFLRSDIHDFFTNIPRCRVLDVITPHLDPDAAALLSNAMHIELQNADDLGELKRLFPDDERGVAQGFCLSTLMGNVALNEFDAAMNGRGIRCLRYVDDLLILGRGEGPVRKAFDSAQARLSALGLSTYDPKLNPKKAQAGSTDHAFDFLGCTVTRGLVQPSADARRALLARVGGLLRSALAAAANPRKAFNEHLTLSRTLYDLGNVLRGWYGSYDFCTQPSVFMHVDSEVDRRVEAFLREFSRTYRDANVSDRRWLLGLQVLTAPRPPRRKPTQPARSAP